MAFGIYTNLKRKVYQIMGFPGYYSRIQEKKLITNWIFQRLLRQNSTCSYSVHFTSLIQGSSRIILGENVGLSIAVNGGIKITALQGTTITIGKDTLIAPNCCIHTGNHGLQDRWKYKKSSVKIGVNCWLGFGAVVLPGVELGDNVTVGANSVVTKSFPPNVVVAGNPAVIIKKL